MSYKQKQVVVIIPAHNEQECIAQVVDELTELNTDDDSARLVDAVIVCDNASTDNTAFAARKAGAHVVKEAQMGYGAACLRAMQALESSELREKGVTTDFVVFMDGDHSMQASELPLLLNELIKGKDLVVGTRVNHMQEKGALSAHQRFGNVLASALIRFLWKKPITDLGPFRAMRYRSLISLDMQDRRFGWTVEMQVKAIQLGLKYSEVPVSALTRIGVSKISGTLKGTIGAAHGIFGKVFQLYWQQTGFIEAVKRAEREEDYVSIGKPS